MKTKKIEIIKRWLLAHDGYSDIANCWTELTDVHRGKPICGALFNVNSTGVLWH